MTAGPLKANATLSEAGDFGWTTSSRLGKDIELLDTTTSTIDHVWDRYADGANDGYVVFAEHQSSGRGRMGRQWHCPRGAGVMCSVLLVDTPRTPCPAAEQLGLITAIATARAVRAATGVDARIDWPNDIVVEDRKLAGILVKGKTMQPGQQAYVLGIGINCLQHKAHFPEPIRVRATSLDLETDKPVHRERVAGALLAHLSEWLGDSARWEADHVRNVFAELSVPFGRRITLSYQGQEYIGDVVDIDPSAALIVRLDNGTQTAFPVAGTTIIGKNRPLDVADGDR